MMTLEDMIIFYHAEYRMKIKLEENE